MKCASPIYLYLTYAENGSFVHRRYCKSYKNLLFTPRSDYDVAYIDPLVIAWQFDPLGRVLFENVNGVAEVRRYLVPCQKCHLCAQAKANETVHRFLAECKSSIDTHVGYALDITYDDASLPYSFREIDGEIVTGLPTLRYSDMQDYMRELRRGIPNIRFLCSCEYGGKSGRPHYHLLLLLPNHVCPDLVFYKKSPSGFALYNSSFFTSFWNKGFITVSFITEKSAFYSSGYVTKYKSSDYELLGIERERVVCSQRLGWTYVDSLDNPDDASLVYGTYVRKLFGRLAKRVVSDETLVKHKDFANMSFDTAFRRSGMKLHEFRLMLENELIEKQRGYD